MAATLELLSAPGVAPLVLEIAEGEGVLVGRDPDPARLPPGLVPANITLRPVSLDAHAVSGNHLAAWRGAEGLVVCDLRSRNGSSLALPPHASVLLPPDARAAVELSPSRRAQGAPAGRPRDAEWGGAGQFPHAVAAELESWMGRAGAAATVRAVRRGEATGEAAVALPFAGEWTLAVDVSAAATAMPAWESLVERASEYAHLQAARLREEIAVSHGDELVIASPAFREAHRRVAEASARALPTVLLGETGSGKSTLARCFHLHSDRARGPFEAVNCAEIDRAFARTRIFGARKGAYTGCHADVAGAVECARGGTLFLDEVAELPLDVQGELLTFLDDQRYKRLGDDRWSQGDVRVVCGTNGDLRRAVREGRFRADLWYRIAGRIVEVAPLRERPDAPSAYDALSPEARRYLTHEYPWPGNFRELAAFVRRLDPAAGAGAVDLDACVAALREGSLDPVRAPHKSGAGGGGAWGAVTASADRAWALRGRAEPARAGEFREYVEEVLKPLFFARALDVEAWSALPDRPTPSYEEMGRRMGCDAATVKNQLARYVEIRGLLERSPQSG